MVSGAVGHRGPAFCGVDVGTQGVRAVVLAATGEQLGVGEAPIADDHRDGPVHEQSADAWWQALVAAVRGAVEAAGPGVEIIALSLDATSGTVVVEAADGAARGPGLMYDDTRAAEQAGRAQTAGAPLWGKLGYRMQPAWALPKVLWLQENEALARGDRVVHQSDHLLRRLTGEPVATDTSHALKTGVDLRTAAWPREVFDELGVPLTLLPEVVLPGTVLGTVSASAAQLTGLRPGDAGASRNDRRLRCADRCTGAASRQLEQRPGNHARHQGLERPASSWIRQARCTATAILTAVGCRAAPRPPVPACSGTLFRISIPSGLADLTARAARLPFGSEPVYPLTGQGERFPFVAPRAHGFGLERISGDPSRFAELCLGIAYVERLAYDVLGTLGADISGPVSFTGGTARNGWWNQLRSDVLGRPAVIPASAQAAGGMAVLAAAPPGQLAETAEAMVVIKETVIPDPGRNVELLAGYLRLVTALADRGWLDTALAQQVLESAAATP